MSRIPSSVFRSPVEFRTSFEATREFRKETGPELADETPLTHVYFALDAETSQVKIGYTTNLVRRMSQLERQRGRKLDLLGSMRGGYNLERAMHGRFSKYRVEGNEWYSAEILGELVALLKPCTY